MQEVCDAIRGLFIACTVLARDPLIHPKTFLYIWSLS
jgi:hypothetical protein